ncbi:MAG TPA: alpha/beta hydrolase, partial [Terriglobales bacterium]|nr:alpha/beta hydrolase [Terriglobales bacterium]
DKAHSLPEADRAAYTTAYSRPGRMRAGWKYFESFPRTAEDFEVLSQTKLSMPVLAVGGEKANGQALGAQVAAIAVNSLVVILKNTGHWLMEENFKETSEALLKFL